MNMLIISLLACLALLNFGFASPLTKRKGVYYLDCARTGQADLQNFCTSPPYSYMCVPGSGVLMVARGSTVCDPNCDCVLRPAPAPASDCYISPFIITPVCGIGHEEAMAKNMTLIIMTIKKAVTKSDADYDKDMAKEITEINVTSDQGEQDSDSPDLLLTPADEDNTSISTR